LGESLQAKENLSFLPERILVQAMLADQEKTYHIYGKLKQNQKYSKMYWLPKTLVLDDPYFTNCDVDVDWDKYEEMDTAGRHPYDHQKEGVKFLVCRKGAILADDMGLGKCLITSELAYTPTGKVKMGDLKVGDYVIGSNGEKTKVLEVHPQPKKELFKITFNDGYSTICCKEHMWTVTSNNGSVNNKNRPVRYTNLTIGQMLDEELELEQKGFGWNEKRPYKFKTYYKQSNGQNKWQIPIVKPIHFENDYELPIEPYLLGVSLGDGHIKGSGVIKIELHKDDFDEIFKNQFINESKNYDNKRCNYLNNLKEEVCTLKLNGTLSHTKFIPEIYKYTSIEDRLSILQGLMDTDGHCMKSKNGNFTGTEYCTVSEQLVDDVAEIVHSLGGIVRKKSKVGSYKKPDGTKVMCKRAYRLNIKLPEGMNPFRLKRKADEYNTPKKYKVGRYIKNIESIGDGESVCIKVDAEDSLFTINHGIVTHNTYQAIIAALEVDAKKVLVICPASVKISWQREIENFGQKAIIVSGSKWPDVGRFTVINFDILKNFHTIGGQTTDKNGEPNAHYRNIVNEKYDLVIIDEAHKIKDHKTQRGKISNEIALTYGIERVWQLTGTPIANRPMDFFNLLKMIGSPLADNWKFFAQRYCDGKRFYKKLKNGQTRQIWITNGASNLDELAIRTKNNLLRRLKTEVLDMPDKTISTIYNTLSKRGLKEYENLWDEYIEKRAEEGKRKISDLSKDIVELGLLRKFIAMETIPNTIQLAKDAIEQGQKVVIFTTFTDELNEIADNFTNSECVIHNGMMTANAKQKSVDSFQNNKKCKVFVGNITSAGVGITLTEGTVVIFNSFSWVPGDNEQAEDRCYRIGQKSNVSVYYQLFTGTVSLVMWHTLMKKQEVINQIIGKNDEHGARLKMLMEDLEENGLSI
jgi:superfamily II DNA or RNA helicase